MREYWSTIVEHTNELNSFPEEDEEASSDNFVWLLFAYRLKVKRSIRVPDTIL
jgi:hypothetical protein